MKTSSELEALCPNIVTQQITNKLDICNKRNMMTLIFGETGRGKTLTAQHWCAANPRAVYLQLCANCTLSIFTRLLAKTLTGQTHGTTTENKNAVEQYLMNNDVLLVIDEANQLLAPPSMSAKKKNMEYVRLDIFEKTATPVAMIFTSYSLGEFSHGTLSGFLEQFLGRAQNRLDIPPRLFSVSEITPIVKNFIAEPPAELIKAACEVASGNGKLRSLVNHLRILAELVAADPGRYSFSGSLLKQVQELYEGGGAWPEE